MRNLVLTVVAIVLLASTTPAHADHGAQKEESVKDGKIVSKSFKRNWLIYKSIGSKTEAKSNKKKRRWWCGWLCKTNKALKVQSIHISNTYYADVDPGAPQVLFGHTEEKTCTDTHSCTLKEWAFGAAPKFSFDGTPTGLDGVPFPLSGVIGVHTIVLKDGTRVQLVTSKGAHP